MKLRRIVTLLITVLVGVCKIQAQPSTLLHKPIVFEQPPISLGLSQNMINSIIQDKEGFLWVGSWSGLFRYDGYSSVRFISENKPGSIKSDKITCIYEDHLGYIWVGTQMEGLFRYDKATEKFEQFKNTAEKHSLSNNNVWSINEDAHNNLWIGTENGLNILNRKTETFNAFYSDASNTQTVSSSHILDMFKSSDNKFWIGTTKGLSELIENAPGQYTFKRYYYTDNSSVLATEEHNYIFRVRELTIKGTSTIWFCTSRGLKKIENGSIRNFTVNGMHSYGTMYHLLPVEGEHPFILTGSERGLNFFDLETNSFSRLLSLSDEQTNLSHASVTCLYMDRGGVLWVGTKKGLNKVDTYSKDFEAYKTSLFDKSKSIISGVQGSVDDGYLVATLGGGLYSFKNGNFIHIRSNVAHENDYLNFIQVLYRAKDGGIWLGSVGNGVYHFYQKDIDKTGLLRHFEHYNTTSKPALNSDFPMTIIEDNNRNIWIGNWHGGLNRITPEKKVITYSDSLLANTPLVTMYSDRAGVLWVGTNGNGLFRIKPVGETIDIRQLSSTSKSAGSLTNNFVNSICEDYNGLLWIGTQGGLFSFERQTEDFRIRKFTDNASANVVVNVLQDNNGKLWLSHAAGLSVIDPTDSLYNKLYNYNDHILGGFFFNNASFKDENGRLFFGGSEGFNIINPTDVVESPNSPVATIQDFRIFGKSVPFNKEVHGRTILKDPLFKTKKIALNANENSLSFEFAALDYSAPEKIQYAYMLEGFDENWNYASADRRYAIYTNLNSGDYTFKVKAANIDGKWSDKITQVIVQIDPPWWNTIWAKLFYALAILAGLYLYRRVTLMRLNYQHDLKVERLQRENIENLNQAKLQFFTNVSHEFRTPLTLILGPLQDLIDGNERNREERDKLLVVNNNANRLLRLVNQLLDFRKAESGNLKLEVSESNIVKFIKEIKLSFDPLATNLKINFTFSTPHNIVNVWFDQDQFEKIMFNLLSNAFKHTPEGGRISIELTEANEDIFIAVEDTGKGIKREHFDNIFHSFFSYDEDKHHSGTGIGLALAKSLVDAHHGTIEFDSQENVFTRFKITLKKGSSHFDESELLSISKDVESMDHYPSLASESMITDESTFESLPSNNQLPVLLVVEDNDDVRSYLKSVFQDLYNIVEAANGLKGYDLAVERSPSLIISDVMMPELDGISLCSKLKSDIKTSHIPIILLTARTSLIFKLEGFEVGADDYITKPFNPQLLKLKARNLIHSRDVMKKVFGDKGILTVEPNKITVTSLDETFLKKALESVEKNMSNPDYGVEDLCKDVAMGRSQLYTKLKGLTGQSGNEFIRTIRLKRAAQFLEQNQFTIAEVTNWVGFTDLQYFRDCFKKLFGVTPSDYIKSSSQKLPKG